MPPEPFTVAAPSLTSHRAGPPSFWLCQCEKSWPSNRMIASEGGGPASMTRGSSFGGGISPGSPAEPLQAANARVPIPARVRKEAILMERNGYHPQLVPQPKKLDRRNLGMPQL